MGVVRQVSYVIRCDTCEDKYGWTQFASMTDMIAVLRSDEWFVSEPKKGKKLRVLCPLHTDEAQP